MTAAEIASAVRDANEAVNCSMGWARDIAGHILALAAHAERLQQQTLTDTNGVLFAVAVMQDLTAQVDADRAELSRLCAENAKLRDQLRAAQDECARLQTKVTKAETALGDIALQNVHVQCLVAHAGEGTYECNVDAPCNACEARHRRDTLQTQLRAAQDECARLTRERDEALKHIDRRCRCCRETASAHVWPMTDDEVKV